MDPPQNLSIDYLDLLPNEILLEILLKFDDLKTLSKLCRTSKRINNICQDEFFWKRKYQKDFGLSGEITLAEGETWKDRYQSESIKQINSPISGGFNHYGVIDQNGNLYMAGNNNSNQLGRSTNRDDRGETPKIILSGVISVACGHEFTAAITKNGKVYVWGDTSHMRHSEYGGGRIQTFSNPTLVKDLISYKALKIVSGSYYSDFGYVVILENGHVYLRMGTWGNDSRIIEIDAIDVSLRGFLLYIVTKNGNLF